MCNYYKLCCTHVKENSAFQKQICRLNQSLLLYSVSFEFTINDVECDIECDIEINFSVLLGVFSVTQLHGKVRDKKIPWIIKKLNKALGLERKSKKVWDILSISENAASIKKYHPETSK